MASVGTICVYYETVGFRIVRELSWGVIPTRLWFDPLVQLFGSIERILMPLGFGIRRIVTLKRV